jgi:hypothetical protein
MLKNKSLEYIFNWILPIFKLVQNFYPKIPLKNTRDTMNIPDGTVGTVLVTAHCVFLQLPMNLKFLFSPRAEFLLA